MEDEYEFEKEQINIGFHDGYKRGIDIGYSEGSPLGYEKGSELGKQLAFIFKHTKFLNDSRINEIFSHISFQNVETENENDFSLTRLISIYKELSVNHNLPKFRENKNLEF